MNKLYVTVFMVSIMLIEGIATAGSPDQRVLESWDNIISRSGFSAESTSVHYWTSKDYCEGEVKNDNMPELIVQADCRSNAINAIHYSNGLSVDWSMTTRKMIADEDVRKFVSWVADHLAARDVNYKESFVKDLKNGGALPQDQSTPVPPMFEARKALLFLTAIAELPNNEEDHVDVRNLISLYLTEHGIKTVKSASPYQRILHDWYNIQLKSEGEKETNTGYWTSNDYCEGQAKNNNMPDLFVQADCRSKAITGMTYPHNLTVNWKAVFGKESSDEDIRKFVSWVSDNLCINDTPKRQEVLTHLVSIGVLPKNRQTPVPPIFEASEALWFLTTIMKLPNDEKHHGELRDLISIYLAEHGTKAQRERISVRDLFWNKQKEYNIPAIPAGAEHTVSAGNGGVFSTLKLSEGVYITVNAKNDLIMQISLPQAVHNSLQAYTKKGQAVDELAFANWLRDAIEVNGQVLLTALTYIAANGDKVTLNRFAAVFKATGDK